MSGGMILQPADSGKADVVLTTKGDLATWDTKRVRKGVSATNYTGLQADSAIADGLTYGATARSTMTGTADMIYSSSANTLSRLAVGSARQVLQTNSATNALEWSNSPQSLMGTTGDILSASSANTLSAISPSTSGDVLTSNGAGVLPSFQTAGGGGAWTELYNSGVMTSTGVLESGEFADKKQIHFMVYCANYTSPDNLAVRFNETRSGNTDGQYGWSAFYNVTASNSQSASRDAIQFLLAGSSGQFFVGCNGYIFNTEDNEKCVTMVSNEIVNTGGSNYPVDSYWTAKWANETDFVNEIQITNDGGTTNNQKVGSSLVIWGAD